MTSPGHLLHLVAWAQVGVLLRVYLAILFGSGCQAGSSWAPCVTSSRGALFTDLPANILGSFLMGLLVSSDVLSNSLKHTLTVEAPLAMLSTTSPLQTHLPLQVGLRTGLCGSLTTFASWITQMVLMMVGGAPMQPVGSQWVEALAGVLLGLLAAMSALVMGQHVALLLYHKLNPGAFIPYGSPAPEQLKLEQSVPRSPPATAAAAASGHQLHAAPTGLHLRSTSSISSSHRPSRTISSTRQGSTTTVVIEASPLAPDGSSSSSAATEHRDAAARRGGSIELAVAGDPEAATATATPFAAPSQRSSWDTSAAAVAGSPLSSAAGSLAHPTVVQVVTEADSSSGVARPAASLAADALAAVVVAALTGMALWRIVAGNLGRLDNPGELFAPQSLWWAVLFGPLGCYIRFYLSRFNGALHGGWKWLPLGTLAANVGACVLDFCMKAIGVRLPLDSLETAVVSGVVTGVGGCLSTVSTWVVEIQRLLLSFPNTSHGYLYIFISVGISVILGLIIYGIPVWTL